MSSDKHDLFHYYRKRHQVHTTNQPHAVRIHAKSEQVVQMVQVYPNAPPIVLAQVKLRLKMTFSERKNILKFVKIISRYFGYLKLNSE